MKNWLLFPRDHPNYQNPAIFCCVLFQSSMCTPEEPYPRQYFIKFCILKKKNVYEIVFLTEVKIRYR